MDETCKQMLKEVKEPLPSRPGSAKKIDDEYLRNGVAEIFLAIEPLTGQVKVKAGEKRGRLEWAHFMKEVISAYPDADRIRLVMDNLNTHSPASFYEAFPPEEARKLAEKLEIHYTPKHGSWLDIAEIGLSVMKSQCLDRRIPDLETMTEELSSWEISRNARKNPVKWQFTSEDARIKLVSLYPKL